MARRNKRLRQVPGALMPTPERLKAAAGYDELTEANAGGVLRKTGAIRVWSALENLYRNRLISPEQYDAGEKLYRDWYLGHVASAQVTMKWSEYISGLGGEGNLDAAERKAFHAKRYAQANLLLDQLRIRKPVHWLVINDIKPEDVGRRLRGYRGQRAASASGTTAVALGLDLLARFYGLTK
jgi:hypothetical protein